MNKKQAAGLLLVGVGLLFWMERQRAQSAMYSAYSVSIPEDVDGQLIYGSGTQTSPLFGEVYS